MLIISKTSFLKKILILKIIITMRISSHKVPSFVAKFQQNDNFLGRFPKNIWVSNFVKNPSSRSRVVPLRTDEKSDRQEEANNSFSQFFENAQKKRNLNQNTQNTINIHSVPLRANLVENT